MFLLLAAGVFLTPAGALDVQRPLELKDAIHSVQGQLGPQDLDVEVARRRLQILEALSRRRFELTPQVGLLSLANPVAMAADLSMGLIFRQKEVSPLALLEARLDLLAAEVEQKRRQLALESESIQSFHAVSDRQRMAALACESVDKIESFRKTVRGWVTAGRLTRAEAIQYDRQILERRVECSKTQRDLRLASSKLARILRVEEDEIRVSDSSVPVLANESLRPVGQLVTVALTRRSAPGNFRETLAMLRRQIESVKEPRNFQLSFRYSQLGQPGISAPTQSLRSSHWLQPSLALRIPLTKDSPFSYERSLVQAKVRKLDLSLDELENFLHTQISEMRIRYEASREEAQSARQSLLLALEYREVVSQRFDAGLENPTRLIDAEESARTAQLSFERVESRAGASFATLISLCGFSQQPFDRGALLIARR